MTWALCLNCGELKFGAFCECEQCGISSTGDMQLDIAFSDHFYEVETLKELGSVVKEIHTHSEDPVTCFWAFISYVSSNHPTILSAELSGDIKIKVEELLRQCTMPSVTLRPSAPIDWESGERS